MVTRALTARDWLIFIDTNILLDFYRLPGDSAKRQLESLLRHKNSIITSEQIKMEFLNNRQRVLQQSLNQLSKPSSESVPMVATGKKATTALQTAATMHKKRHDSVKTLIKNILRNPSIYDSVYQNTKKLFDNNCVFNLKRPNPVRYSIRRLARQRFVLGYPPRKSSDNSIGDAINWEWLIHCAQNCANNENILIVSRDTDYGCIIDNEMFLNDWLKSEFKSRVSRKRKIEITTKLTVALKKLDEAVTAADEAEESKIIEQSAQNRQKRDNGVYVDVFSPEDF